MARPTSDTPTPAELDVLRVLWDRGACTVREVLEAQTAAGRSKAYTSCMSLLNVMAEKGLVTKAPEGRACRYAARHPEGGTLGGRVADLWRRAFDRSAGALVARLLDTAEPGSEELARIRAALDRYEAERTGAGRSRENGRARDDG